MRARHEARVESLVPNASVAERLSGVSRYGAGGNGCVGHARSPGTSRAGSAENTDQALAAPVGRATGSHFQRSRPVRASNARTTPSGASVRWLSETAAPTMTRPLMTTGGDVTPYSPW